jgi:hypothetical protein
MPSIFTKQTSGTATYNIPPIAAIVVFWFLIVQLGQIEAGQGCLVGLRLTPRLLDNPGHITLQLI